MAVISPMVPILFLDHPKNKYSLNALCGAIDSHPATAGSWPVYFMPPDDPLPVLAQVLSNHGRVVAALSVHTRQLPAARSFISAVRAQFNSRVIILAGGPHPTARPIDLLHAGADFVIRGEAEDSLPLLLRALTDRAPLSAIPGLSDPANPEPDMAPAADMARYHPFSLRVDRLGPMEITRGCPYRCAYCQTGRLHGHAVRHRPLDMILDTMRIIKNPRFLHYRAITPNVLSYGSPDGLTPDLDVLERLLSGLWNIMRPEGRVYLGSFPSEVRPEHVTADSLQLLKRFVHNDNLVVGAQSGSGTMLGKCRRGHGTDAVLSAVRLGIKAGFGMNVDFIFGMPGETLENMRESLRFARELSAMGARIHLHAYMELPGTAWEGLGEPGIPDEIQAELLKLCGSGQAFGQWEKQMTGMPFTRSPESSGTSHAACNPHNRAVHF